MPRTKTTSRKPGYKARKPHNKKKTYSTYKARPKRTSKALGPFRAFVANDPFRPRMNVKLTYTQNFVLTTGTAGVFGSSQEFSLNSVYDPDITGTGHQPYGYDSMSSLYKRYKVNGCLMKCTFEDPSDESATLGIMVKSPSQSDSISSLTIQQAKERPMCVTRTLMNSGKQQTRINSYFPMATVFGWTKEQFHGDMENTTAAVSGSPGSQPKIEFAVAQTRGVSGYSAVVELKLIYFVTFYERIIQSTS